jgi:hypothetical protein
MLEEYGSIRGNIMAYWQSKIWSTLENLLMIVGRMHTTNQIAVLERIQVMNDLLISFMIKEAIPHLGGGACQF